MRQLNSITTAVLCTLLVLILLSPEPAFSTARGDTEAGALWKKVYVSINLIDQSLGGDFDGETFYTDGRIVDIVPEIGGGRGFSLSLGMRGNIAGFELTYKRSNHDGNWVGLATRQTYKRIGLDVPFYFIDDRPLQPFVAVGAYIHRLTVKDGSVEVRGENLIGATGDATYNGLGLCIGPGAVYYLNASVALRGSLIYESSSFSSVKSVGHATSTELDEGLSGSGWNLSLGMMFGF